MAVVAGRFYRDADGIFHRQFHAGHPDQKVHGKGGGGGDDSSDSGPLQVEIKKISAASRSYGRGMDNARIPAGYGVHSEGKMIGTIRSDQVSFMGRANWMIEASSGYHFKGRSLWKSLAEAKTAASKGFYKKEAGG